MRVSRKGFNVTADTDTDTWHLHQPERLPQVRAWFQPPPIWCPGTWDLEKWGQTLPRQLQAARERAPSDQQCIDRGGCKAAHVAIRSVKLRCSVLW